MTNNLQNSRLATIQSDLEEIRSVVKSGNIHVALSSHVKQRAMLICVMSNLDKLDISKFTEYLFNKSNIEIGNVCVIFADTSSFIEVAYDVCCKVKTCKNDVVVNFADKMLKISNHKMLNIGIQPPLIDQYIKILQEKKLSA